MRASPYADPSHRWIVLVEDAIHFWNLWRLLAAGFACTGNYLYAGMVGFVRGFRLKGMRTVISTRENEIPEKAKSMKKTSDLLHRLGVGNSGED
jgi:hypothetical protein